MVDKRAVPKPSLLLFRRLRKVDGLLTRDAPLVFRRTLPSGEPSRHACGTRVEVRLHPTLRVFVLALPERDIALSGHFVFGELLWDQTPSPAFPATSLALISADIRDMLRLFRIGEIAPRAWTSDTGALEHL